MISIGNDIVDLNAINKQRTADTRFYSKFITPAEIELHDPAIATLPLQSFVWLLWSVKEAVYKYQKRLNPQLVFAPIKIVVKQITVPALYNAAQFNSDSWEGSPNHNDFCFGCATGNGQTLFFKTIIHQYYIATIVSNNSLFPHVYWGVQRIANGGHQHQSQLVRTFLLNKLSSVFIKQDLALQKSPVGYPVLLVNNIEACMPISLAHHGLFTSYCFQLNLQGL
ncbi:phosphopantetheinyl transferase (holo-ACP synthase) [Mucilaginibacter gracilis]|uniref:Phosphopantetheinyl transferase (Holo-ACP synthase) n=1 Tax=Mucilaginibacter gracilis TaxID=423350 RepID=A0A495J4M4_9SPHI|nr:4'-phosphopantetheinyl transferase superfamily protein [Mucilaginibacter gracilis]RKR83936.1 phosphopantetheinyl transferase (holo-ACP synthase) [Mucilaginibacter gracilis]